MADISMMTQATNAYRNALKGIDPKDSGSDDAAGARHSTARQSPALPTTSRSPATRTTMAVHPANCSLPAQ